MEPEEPARLRAGAGGDAEETPWPEKRLFDAVARWNPDGSRSPAKVIDAARGALADGLDSPALRELAAASPERLRAAASDGVMSELSAFETLVYATLDELGIPTPESLRPGRRLARGGGVERRPGTDGIRFEVAEAPEPVRGFQVLVYVNDAEMTSAGAGLGMDPYAVFVPDNLLVATSDPHIARIARCGCGVYGCSLTDVSIVRDGKLVHWDWLFDLPMDRGATFPAGEYDAEVARLGSDYSWETPERTAGRLILNNVDKAKLAHNGLRVSGVSKGNRDPSRFHIGLVLDDEYQVFLDIPWKGRTPAALADCALAELARPPKEWRAEWFRTMPDINQPPRIAGRRWRRRYDPRLAHRRQ